MIKKIVSLAILCVAFFNGSLLYAKCRGDDLYKPLAPEIKRQLEERASTQPFHEGLYWQVTKGTKSSYFIGTFHIEGGQANKIPDFVLNRVGAARKIFVELETENITERLKDEIFKNPELITLKEGNGLKDNLPPEKFQRLENYLSARNIPVSLASTAQPWLLIALLSVPSCVGETLSLGVDAQIEHFARSSDLSVEALETFQEAISGLMKLDPKTAALAIEASIDFIDINEDFLQSAQQLYLAEKPVLISELNFALLRGRVDPEKVAILEETMGKIALLDRNKLWLKRLKADLRKGDVVVAVGALHLPGENGLLNLLQNSGYTITRLDN